MEILRKHQHGNGKGDQGTARDKKNCCSPASLLVHDTRNWLTVLQMYCGLLQSCGAEDTRYQNWIDELATAVGRGQGLVASLLDSVQNRQSDTAQKAPLNGASLHGNPSPGRAPANATDLASAIASRLPLLQKLAGDKVQVKLEIETETAEANLAEGDFDRILHNLAMNAIEAMPGGGELLIALSSLHVEGSGATEQSSKLVLLRVSDTGVGISPSLLPSIFEPGVSGKRVAANNPNERGLGLAVVRDLTLRAGGSVRVSSHGRRGASFEIELPAAHPARWVHAQFPDPALRDRRGAELRNRQPTDSLQNAKPLPNIGSGRRMDRGSARQSGDPAPKLALRKKA